jgi:hypothetical protein
VQAGDSGTIEFSANVAFTYSCNGGTSQTGTFVAAFDYTGHCVFSSLEGDYTVTATSPNPTSGH